MSDVFESIKRWSYERTAFSFLLPDGTTIGKPFDNQYLLEGIEETQDGIVIYMSSNIELQLKGDLRSRIEGFKYKIFGFNNLRFIVDGVVKQEYKEGEFCLGGF